MKRLMLVYMLFHSLVALANKEAGNGGDVCEDRFKIVRDDIQSWITKGGSASLVLPTGIFLPQYTASMLDKIAQAEVNCTGDKILIGGDEKTCSNRLSATGVPQIICNNKRFMDTKEDEQYVLVHHEYAGLSDLEVNDDGGSKYPISNQITGFLESQVTRRLVVKPPGANTGAECVSEFGIYGKKYSTWDKKRGAYNGISVRGPSVSISPGDTQLFHYGETPSNPNYYYNVSAYPDGTVAISTNMAKKPGSGYTSGARGFVTNDSVALGDLWFQDNIGIGTGPCKVATFRVACAATKETAQKSLGNPWLERLPKGCGF